MGRTDGRVEYTCRHVSFVFLYVLRRLYLNAGVNSHEEEDFQIHIHDDLPPTPHDFGLRSFTCPNLPTSNSHISQMPSITFYSTTPSLPMILLVQDQDYRVLDLIFPHERSFVASSSHIAILFLPIIPTLGSLSLNNNLLGLFSSYTFLISSLLTQ